MAKPKQTGLGRGLGELFRPTDDDVSRETRGDRVTDTGENGESAALADGSRYLEVPIESIVPNPKQPRSVFDEEMLRELADSIGEVGVLQPVVVRHVGDGYELIMGERRLRASKLAGRESIPVIVRGTDDTDLLRDALLENLHRAQLNPLEEAAAYQQMLEDFNCTQDELSRRIKRSRPQISNTIRLLRLPSGVQRRVAAGVISAGHARALLMVDDASTQERLAQRIVSEGLSVRSTEELVTVGEGTGTRSSRPRGSREPSAKALELSRELSDHFDTRVKVDIGKNRGKITIEFASEDDLERVMRIIERP
ncbi:ParB/RepB/Spo0J family partition protein [Aestuariimicrobium sp. T2.26MG-19.2B]|uniref:ParB/RepB/Spo0J family partition protein n=1 Tax=Aestuariimicrobium sp. T2.26MG-19.2B TaxID=3040679 RepID=UPI00247763F3|nr:ParB/RepB/Spo0J family partition protein [Aestuariimicrobium sp. T2.26MG-19.2B]CAI9403693.1 putative chromosome-partitioning protein ParB [Aestuariimicrobium sp. T2.26MG-19.2B]